jgi:hypothetical protein
LVKEKREGGFGSEFEGLSQSCASKFLHELIGVVRYGRLP